MFSITQTPSRPSLVSICSSIAPKEQHCLHFESEHPQPSRSRLQRWAKHIPVLPKKIGRRLQRSKSTNSAPVGDIVKAPSRAAVPVSHDIPESPMEDEDKFDLPSPQLDAFRMPVLLDAEFARITTGKSTASLTLQRQSTIRLSEVMDLESTPCQSPSSVSATCGSSTLPLTPVSPTPTMANERECTHPFALRAKPHSWYGEVSRISEDKQQEQQQQQQQEQEQERKCSLRPRLISPASEVFLADTANCSSATLLASIPSNGAIPSLDKIDTPSSPSMTSTARIMRVLSSSAASTNDKEISSVMMKKSKTTTGLRSSLAATLSLSPRNSLSLGLQSSMERNCSGTTTASIESTIIGSGGDGDATTAMIDMDLACCFKPVFELNQAQIDANERLRRQQHASALFDRLAEETSHRGGRSNRRRFKEDTLPECKFEPGTLRLTLTPSLVRGDEFTWSDDSPYGSSENDTISVLTITANSCKNVDDDGDEEEDTTSTFNGLMSGNTQSLRKQRSNGSLTRVPHRMLSKGSLQASWIPEETSEETL
ncbi:hypothetical protein BDF22DRAFT_743160 [Syncephalis plumigaleata]|nr:hypothetical protein BDF22DRAFT_743160 [Syncephalis plumigaleata]